MEKVLFYHGGPGLNSNPERHLLTATYANAGFHFICWDEPSLLRPVENIFKNANAFENYLNSAADFFLQHYQNVPIVLMSHSFGCYAAHYLQRLHPDKIKFTLLISSAFSISAADRNVFNSVYRDYSNQSHERAKDIGVVLNNYSGKFDENTINGWQITSGHPNLFDFYWRKKDLMLSFLQHYSNEYAPDTMSFFKVREFMYPVNTNPSSLVRTYAVFGQFDNVITLKEELTWLEKLFSNFEYTITNNSAHYPHIEDADAVLEILIKVLR